MPSEGRFPLSELTDGQGERMTAHEKDVQEVRIVRPYEIVRMPLARPCRATFWKGTDDAV